jgi:hypothetical protein
VRTNIGKKFLAVVLAGSLIGSMKGDLSWAQSHSMVADAYSDPLFDKEVVGLRYIVPVGDIEGLAAYFRSLEAQGYIRWDIDNQRYDIVDPLVIIVFDGDIMRRGSFGIRATKFINDLLTRFPAQTRSVIGNHDGNILSFHIVKAEIDLNQNKSYTGWLAKHSLTNSLFNQIYFWSGEMQVTEKVENYWLELALLRRGVEFNDLSMEHEAPFVTIEGNKRIINTEFLATIVSPDEMARSFYDFIRSGGGRDNAWVYLERSKLRLAIIGRTRDGRRPIIDFSHSGMSTQDNLGVIPTLGARYVQIDGTQNLMQDSQLDPKTTSARDYYFRWLADMDRDFKHAQLDEYLKLLKEFYERPQPTLARRKEILTQLNSLELVFNVDSQWSKVTGKFYRSDSQVAPDPRQFLEDSLPAIPTPQIIAAEIKIGIAVTGGGHKPIGDIATAMVGFDATTQEILMNIFHDTSYSPVEGNNRTRIYENGAVRVIGRTRQGTEVIMERPGLDTMAKWQELHRKLVERAVSEKKKISELEITAEEKLILERMDRYSRLGKVAGGRLIIGFVGKTNETGGKYIDYNEYMTARQEGRKFVYEPIEVWGIMEYEEKTGPLQFAEADLTEMMRRAEQEKADGLRKLGNEVLTGEQFLKALEGKTVYWEFGPTAAYKQVRADAEGNAYVSEHSLPAHKNFYINLPANEDSLVIVGGTQGWESDITEVIVEANKVRVTQNKKPIEFIGTAALVFGLGEIDPSVKTFFLIPGAFYWLDYFPKLMNNFVLKSKAKAIHLGFAGGGGILGGYIKQAIEFARGDSRIDVTLERGVTISKTSPAYAKKGGATDQFIDRMTENVPGVSVVRAKEGQFVNERGQSIRTWFTSQQPHHGSASGPAGGKCGGPGHPFG